MDAESRDYAFERGGGYKPERECVFIFVMWPSFLQGKANTVYVCVSERGKERERQRGRERERERNTE